MVSDVFGPRQQLQSENRGHKHDHEMPGFGATVAPVRCQHFPGIYFAGIGPIGHGSERMRQSGLRQEYQRIGRDFFEVGFLDLLVKALGEKIVFKNRVNRS